MTIVPQPLARRPFRVPLAHSLWTARILFGGPEWRDVVRSLGWGVGLLLIGVLHVLGNLHRKGDEATAQILGALYALTPGILTMILEEKWARRLAFIDLLPQRAGALHFLLWPLRLYGLFVAVIVTLAGHFPPLAVPIITGCIWWSISMGHFCAGRGAWIRLLVIPFSFFPSMFFAWAVFGGDSPSPNLVLGSAVAMTTALLTLLVPFGGKVGRLLSRATPRPRRSRVAIVARPIPPEAFLVLAKRRRTAGAFYRAAKLAIMGTPGGWVIPPVLLSQIVLVGIGMMRSPTAWIYWLLPAMTVSGILTRATDRSRFEFFYIRPLPRGRLFTALVLACVALVLIFPAEQCLFIKVAASMPFRPFDRGVWWFLTQGLGVSSHNLVRSAQGPRIAMTSDLVSLLYREAFREGLLGLAVLFIFPLWTFASRAGLGFRWTIRGLTLVVFASTFSYYPMLFNRSWWPLPPLWLAAALAVTGGGVFFRQVVRAPAG